MKKKILILEDDEVGILYTRFLISKGYDVILARDGIEGLEKLKDMEPDLIIMDVSMPRMSGVGFYEEICTLRGKPRYPVLVVTGRMDLELTFANLPVDGVILKPIQREEFLKKIENILNKPSDSMKNRCNNILSCPQK